MAFWISLNKKNKTKLLSIKEPNTAAEEISPVPQTLEVPNTCRYGNDPVVNAEKAVKEVLQVLLRSVLNCQK